jgi:HEAT repeat protein
LVAWLLAELGFPKKPFLQEREEILAGLLQNDPAESVRCRAVHSLGVLGTLRSLQIVAAYAGDKSRCVRREVATFSGHMEAPYQHVALKLAQDSVSSVREMAVFALGQRRNGIVRGTLNLLHRSCGDRDKRVRHEAIRACISQGDFSVAALLFHELDASGVSAELVDAVQEIVFAATKVSRQPSAKRRTE